MSRPLVRVVFALLVFATIAAFFVTQQLKSEFPLVIRFATQPVHFSPNGDGFRDEAVVGFDLSEPATVTFAITDGEGNEVRRLVEDRRLAGDTKHRFRWDGNDDEGRPAPDGTYRMRVVRRDESRVIDSVKAVTVDRDAARPPAALGPPLGHRAPVSPGPCPACASATAARETPPPSSGCFAPTTARPGWSAASGATTPAAEYGTPR